MLSSSLKIDILTYFSNIYDTYCNHSFFGRLRKNGLLEINCYNFLQYSYKLGYKKIDSKPLGGGQGLILRYDFIYDFLNYIYKQNIPLIIHPSPSGYILTINMIEKLRYFHHIAFLNTRYEGIDCRVLHNFCVLEISIGDYILYDGDTATFVILNAIVRDRFVKNIAKLCESFDDNLLEYDQYTHPLNYFSSTVPNILLSGNHNKINEWRLKNSLIKTKYVRNDIYVKYKKDNS